ncbi:transglycosylase SLT domain-containing protein [Actinoplanes awajinensis]|nr:transglycosylase SLT domain-containing protein [Actinoplanes awajinensis]
MKVRLLAVATAMLMVTAGCGLLGSGDDDTSSGSAPVAVTAADSPEPEESPTPEETEEESPRPKPKPSKTTTSKKPTVKATPTEDPFNRQLPDCAKYVGKAVSFAKAKAALNAAAAKVYWPINAPKLKVPAELVRVVAWHESGWVSNIQNCDGGYGLMQVMPDTEEFINGRFTKSYDAGDYRQNAILGANYLAWLTKYFGENFFKDDYSLSTSKCKTDASPCLLNMVIDGYNMGAGSTETAFKDGKKLSNPEYVALIRANMRDCDCDRY